MNGVIRCWRCGQPFTVFPTMHGQRIICGRCQAPIDINRPSPAPIAAPIPTLAPYDPVGSFRSADSFNPSSASSWSAGAKPDVDPDARSSRWVIAIGAGVVGVTVCGLLAAIALPLAMRSIKQAARDARSASTDDNDNSIGGDATEESPRAPSLPQGSASPAPASVPPTARGNNGGPTDGIEFGSDVQTGNGGEFGGIDFGGEGPIDKVASNGAARSDSASRAASRAAESATRLRFAEFSFEPPTSKWRNIGPDREIFVVRFSSREKYRGESLGEILIAVYTTDFPDSLSFARDYTSDGEQRVVEPPILLDGAVAYRLVGNRRSREQYTIACVRHGQIFLIDAFAVRNVNATEEIERIRESWRWN